MTSLLLHAVGPDGKDKWPAFAMQDFCWDAAPAIGDDGKIYVAVSGKLYCIDQQKGSKEWTTDHEGGSSGTSIGIDGTVYFVTGTKFHAVCGTAKGLAKSAWPKALHDGRNSGNIGVEIVP